MLLMKGGCFEKEVGSFTEENVCVMLDVWEREREVNIVLKELVVLMAEEGYVYVWFS
jgi:hypothetical protein